MAKPLGEATFATMDLDSVVGWLSSTTSDLKEVQPDDPTNPDRRVLLIVAYPEGLYAGHHRNFTADQRVALAIVYVPPYIETYSFKLAHDSLVFWRQEKGRLQTPACLFLRVLSGRGAAPFTEPYPLWFDYDSGERLQECGQGAALMTRAFRVFQLHRAIVPMNDLPNQEAQECICTPRGPGHTGLFRRSTPERALPRAKNVATLIRFAAPSDKHWALTMDQAFDTALAQLAQSRLDKESAVDMAATEQSTRPSLRGKVGPTAQTSKR